jgi:hypothetical protein
VKRNVFGRTWNEKVVAYFNMLFMHSSGETEENQKSAPESRDPTIFEPVIYRIKSRSDISSFPLSRNTLISLNFSSEKGPQFRTIKDRTTYYKIKALIKYFW